MKHLKKLRSLLLILPLVGGWWACTSTDPEPSLPPITQEGKNTFGCKINGKNWVPEKVQKYLTTNWEAISVDYTRHSSDNTIGYLGLSAVRPENDGYSAFDFFIDELSYNGKFRTFSMSYNRYEANKNSPYNFKITRMDTLNKIIAGEFYFTCIMKNGNKLIITDGRFDVKYQ